MTNPISYESFEQVDLRSGTIVKVEPFPRAKKPAYKIWADFGPEIGVLQTSAQVTTHYTPESLLERSIVGCVNLGEKNIAGFLSQFLLVGFSDEEGNICLVTVDPKVPNGKSYTDIQIILPEEAKVLCQAITAELPEYFGLPEVNAHYAEGMLNRLSIAAFIDQSAVGLLTLEFPYPNNANIYWMGIKAAYHRRGIGKAMIRFAMALAASKGAQSLTVETLSPSECDENYLKTYRFYEICGFKSLFDLKPEGYPYYMVYMGQFIHQPAVGLASHPAFKIKSLAKEDIPQIVGAFADIQWDKPASLFEKYLDEQSQKQRCVWLVFNDDHQFAGYVTLKWRSDYQPFQEQHIPEIMDLNVLPGFRNQGIGSQLLEIAEQEAGQKTQTVGIGVGLHKDYGAAQRLYVKKGYIPDAQGLTYAYQPIEPGSRVCLDDDLVLWFTKKLGNSLLIPTQLLAQKQ